MTDYTLVELWQLYGRQKYITDKGDGHSFLPVYDSLFAPFKNKKINIFEIGHSSGGALRLFDDYFTHPETRIVGIDQSENDWLRFYNNAPYETSRVKTYIYDVHDLTEKWFRELNFMPDIIIDDSNHQLATQIFVVLKLFPFINEGGLLIIEDFDKPQERKYHFELLKLKFELVDLNHIAYTGDNALMIFRK